MHTREYTIPAFVKKLYEFIRYFISFFEGSFANDGIEYGSLTYFIPDFEGESIENTITVRVNTSSGTPYTLVPEGDTTNFLLTIDVEKLPG